MLLLPCVHILKKKQLRGCQRIWRLAPGDGAKLLPETSRRQCRGFASGVYSWEKQSTSLEQAAPLDRDGERLSLPADNTKACPVVELA